MKKMPLLLIAFLMVACQHQQVPPSMSTGHQAILTGKIIEAGIGQPSANAFVYVYKESNTHFFGPPNYISQPSDADGNYSMYLSPGKYYIFARKRKSGAFQGPLQKNDYFSDMRVDLVTLPRGRTTLDLDIQKLEGQQFYRPDKFSSKSDTAISGRILDNAGKPVQGAFAFVYLNRFVKQQPPHYGSVSSDIEGHYIIYLDQGGEYIIGARVKAKEPPEKGELVGFYRNDRETSLSVATGSILGNIDITIAPFSPSP